MASAFFTEIAVKYPQLAGECAQLTVLYTTISHALFTVGDKTMAPQKKVILLETALRKELEAVELIKAILNFWAEPTTQNEFGNGTMTLRIMVPCRIWVPSVSY